jgi:RHS repeat-associated protein
VRGEIMLKSYTSTSRTVLNPWHLLKTISVTLYHNDHLGTPQELTDWEGRVVWSARYRVYGNVVRKDVEQVENNIRFQGQYWDEETGLHYNRHRYYDPGTGQFTQQDPIGLLGGVNSYRYAANPIGWIDPLGLSCEESNGSQSNKPKVIPGKYKLTKEMDPMFKREEDPDIFHPVWGTDTVKYLDDNELLEHELGIQNGKLVHANGPLAGTPFDTAEASTFFSGDGKAIFVMAPEGRIFASTFQEPGKFHHSSLAQGKPVAAAGELTVIDGNLVEVSNKSGHYQPTQKMNDQLLDELKERGLPEEGTFGLDNVMRTGYKDPVDPPEDFGVEPPYIPKDWNDDW